MEIDIAYLLSCKESEWLDFKQEWPDLKTGLLHDILCLANAYTDRDRFLVIGVTDPTNDAPTVVGVEKKHNNASIQNWLRGCGLNRIPTVSLDYIQKDEKFIGVLRIANRPDKPFWVEKKDQGTGKRARCGVIYTRLGDTNTPWDSSAEEAQIELMWRERFGIGLAPLERFKLFVPDIVQWKKFDKDFDDPDFYYAPYPEYTIQKGERDEENFDEPWLNIFPDSRGRRYSVKLCYHTTVLRSFSFVSCDGGRYQLPLPKLLENGQYVWNPNSLAYQVSKIFNSAFDGRIDTFLRVRLPLHYSEDVDE